MTPKKRESLKNNILRIINRNGIALRDQTIADSVALPDGTDLGELLEELVAEGQLTRSFTLLSNGERSVLYDVRSAR